MAEPSPVVVVDEEHTRAAVDFALTVMACPWAWWWAHA